MAREARPVMKRAARMRVPTSTASRRLGPEELSRLVRDGSEEARSGGIGWAGKKVRKSITL